MFARRFGVLSKHSQHAKAKRALHDIWMAETKADAETAFDTFIEGYRIKYDKAAECLRKDRGALLAFYDFPAEHWKHLRTTDEIGRMRSDEIDKRFYTRCDIFCGARATSWQSAA